MLEARYFNTSIACSDLLPHREVAGASALLFDPYDEEDIKKSLELGITKNRINQGNETGEMSPIYSIQEFAFHYLEKLSSIAQLARVD